MSLGKHQRQAVHLLGGDIARRCRRRGDHDRPVDLIAFSQSEDEDAPRRYAGQAQQRSQLVGLAGNVAGLHQPADGSLRAAVISFESSAGQCFFFKDGQYQPVSLEFDGRGELNGNLHGEAYDPERGQAPFVRRPLQFPAQWARTFSASNFSLSKLSLTWATSSGSRLLSAATNLSASGWVQHRA